MMNINELRDLWTEESIARIPRPATGTYDGKPFVLLDQVTRIEEDGLEWVMANVIKFSDGSVKYVWADDRLLKFDLVGVEEKND